MVLPWLDIDTVLLDMDGTLLDLNFDNYFWLTHVPSRYAEKHGLDFEEARSRLIACYREAEGTLAWYCVDHWTRELKLPIARLKEEVQHLIAVHPHVVPFLTAVRALGKRTVLVTNAHHKSLTLKLKRTKIHRYLDAIACAHDLGTPKEHPEFWGRLAAREPFEPERTLLIDDSAPVLAQALRYGIKHLIGVRRPDSRAGEKTLEGFASIADFSELTAGLPSVLSHKYLAEFRRRRAGGRR